MDNKKVMIKGSFFLSFSFFFFLIGGLDSHVLIMACSVHYSDKALETNV